MASNYTYTIGRRKTATATVRLYEGKGESMINGKSLSEVYPSKIEQVQLLAPFATLEKQSDDFYFTAKVTGSGPQSQLQAIRHGIARALAKLDPQDKKALKVAGFITRDPRMVERKKPGLRKARKSEQYSKR